MDEFVVRTASASTKKMSLLKFHKNDKFVWNDVKVRKEGDHHPWQLKVGSGKSARRFKAVREGGVSDNASYFVFFKIPDQNTYEVCPINDWFNVSATQRYKALSAEEAEKKYEQRHKMLNLFSVMHLKNKETNEEGEGKGSFKVSEKDEWDEGGQDEEDQSGDEEITDKKRKNNKNNKKEAADKSDKLDEAVEESDEGDFEGEVDYMSDTSSSSSNNEGEDIKSISEEAALKDLLQSASEDEDETKKDDESDAIPAGPNEDPQIKQEPNPDLDINMSDSSSDSDVSDIDESEINSVVFMKKLEVDAAPTATTTSATVPTNTSTTTTTEKPTLKRKVSGTDSASSSKRPCTTDSGQEIEDLVRRYLMRKPMTTKALLKQLRAKLKGSGVNQKELEVVKIAEIIRKINPEKLFVNKELLLFIRSV